MGLQRHLRPRLEYPVLGPIARSRGCDWWTAKVDVGEQTIEFRFGGLMEPNRPLVQHAHDLLATWPSFERTLATFLTDEANHWSTMRSEILLLELEAVGLFWPNRPGCGVLFFRSPSPFRSWQCEYQDGLPVRLHVRRQPLRAC